ncbi:MAG: ribonuclease H-like domain-containing protein [Candidatus Thorarchaeota archaeon]
MINEIDLGILVINHVIGLPFSDLKGLANHFGFSWTHNDLVGRIVGEMVSRYYDHGEIPDWNRLLEYNQEDVLATKIVLDELMKLDVKDL